MANAIYQKYKQSLLSADTNVAVTSGRVKLSLVSSLNSAVFDNAHQYYSSIKAGVTSSSVLTNVTATNGVFDSDDVTLYSVTGDLSEAIVFWIDVFSSINITAIQRTGGIVTVTTDSAHGLDPSVNNEWVTIDGTSLATGSGNNFDGTWKLLNQGVSANQFQIQQLNEPDATGTVAGTVDITDDANSRLIAWMDTGVTGLPFTPNGGNIDIVWNSTGIFRL